MEGMGEEKLYFLLLKSIKYEKKKKKTVNRAKCPNSFFLSPIIVETLYDKHQVIKDFRSSTLKI